MAFLKDHDILTIRDYMDPALRARIGRFTPAPREFFTEVDYRDPEVMRTHGYHWFDHARMVERPARERRSAAVRCSTTSSSRAPKGHATGWEEMMLQAGMFDARPRSRELIYVLLAQRAARALGDLRMHAQPGDARAGRAVRVGQHAARLAAPRGQHRPRRAASLPAAAGVRHELRHRQDSDRAADRRAAGVSSATGSRLKRFMDEFNAAGLIPISLHSLGAHGRRARRSPRRACAAALGARS